MKEFIKPLLPWLLGAIFAVAVGWGAFGEKLGAHERMLNKHEAELDDLKSVAADVRIIKTIVLKRYGFE